MHSPFVSVVIPNYCHARYLDRRIQSVLNQTYKNFEVIILDDASPDDGASKSVIEKYRDNQHVSHIIYNEQNSGSTFKQWKKGLELAKGELIWIAESDDYCDEELLELLVEQFSNNNNITFSYCTSNIVGPDNEHLDWHDKAEKIPNQVFDGILFIKKYMMLDNSVLNASAVLFKKVYALNVDESYMTYKAAGDHLFWILLAEMGNVSHVSKKMNYFRQHKQKVTQSKAADGTQNRELYRTICYLRSKGYINLIDELAIADYYIYKTLYMTSYDDPTTVKSLIKQWNYHKLFNRYTLPIIHYFLVRFYSHVYTVR